MRRKYQLLTPEKAWQRYGYGVSVEFFIADYFCAGYTDLWEMCEKHIDDNIFHVDGLVTVEERSQVTRLFYQYIRDYIASKGGLDKLEFGGQLHADFAGQGDLGKLIKDLKALEQPYKETV